MTRCSRSNLVGVCHLSRDVESINRLIGFLFVALAALQGCSYSHSVDIDQISDFEIRDKDRPVLVTVPPGSQRHKELVAWIADNRGGWDHYIVTLPAPDVMISTDQFGLYVAGDAVFLGQRDSMMQVKQLNEDEVRFFNKLAFANDR